MNLRQRASDAQPMLHLSNALRHDSKAPGRQINLLSYEENATLFQPII